MKDQQLLNWFSEKIKIVFPAPKLTDKNWQKTKNDLKKNTRANSLLNLKLMSFLNRNAVLHYLTIRLQANKPLVD